MSNNNNKDEEEDEVETEEELKSTRPGSKMVSPTAAIVVGLVAGLVAWTAKGWKEVNVTVFALLIFFHTIPVFASFCTPSCWYSLLSSKIWKQFG